MGALLREGWEFGGTNARGGNWFQAFSAPFPGISSILVSGGATIVPSFDFNGKGGRYFANSQNSNVTFQTAAPLARGARELYVRTRVALVTTGFQSTTYQWLGNQVGGVNHVNLQHQTFTSMVRLFRGGTLLSTSIVGVMEDWNTNGMDWTVLLMKVFIAEAVPVGPFSIGGRVEGYKDYNFSAPFLSVFDTDTSQEATNTADLFLITNGRGAFDEIAINDVTLSYTAGTGAQPVVGDIFTGGTTGSTGIVTAVFDTSGVSPALAGTVQLAEVTFDGATIWNGNTSSGTQPFATDVAITTGGVLVSATVTPGLDLNSGFPRDAYMFGLTTNGDVAGSIQMVPSAGTVNSNNVDDIPANDAAALAEWNETGVAGDRDLYELEDVAARGFVAADITTIETVTLNATCERDGNGPGNLRFVGEDTVTVSGELDLGSDQPLSTSPDGHALILETAPGGADWNSGGTVIALVDGLRVGAKMNA